MSDLQMLMGGGGPLLLRRRMMKMKSISPEPVFAFSVSATKKVSFARSNLYWDGSKFAFEENPWDYPTKWDANHVGHFFWSKNASVAVAQRYSGYSYSRDVFFAANGGAIEGYTVLSTDEWRYLNDHACVKNSGNTYGQTIAGIKCFIFKPDGFTGSVQDNYTEEEWATAEERYGLVAVPGAGTRGSYSGIGAIGDCYIWTPSCRDINDAYNVFIQFNTINRYYSSDACSVGQSVRLVKEL